MLLLSLNKICPHFIKTKLDIRISSSCTDYLSKLVFVVLPEKMILMSWRFMVKRNKLESS